MAHSTKYFACLEIQVIVKFWFQTGMRTLFGLYTIFQLQQLEKELVIYPVIPDLHAIPTLVSNPRIKCETAAFGCYFCSSR